MNSLMAASQSLEIHDAIFANTLNLDTGLHVRSMISGWRYFEECGMTETVARMIKEGFREMLDTLIEQKLLEILGDHDEGLEIRESVRERLIRQREEVTAGERGQSLQTVT